MSQFCSSSPSCNYPHRASSFKHAFLPRTELIPFLMRPLLSASGKSAALLPFTPFMKTWKSSGKVSGPKLGKLGVQMILFPRFPRDLFPTSSAFSPCCIHWLCSEKEAEGPRSASRPVALVASATPTLFPYFPFETPLTWTCTFCSSGCPHGYQCSSGHFRFFTLNLPLKLPFSALCSHRELASPPWWLLKKDQMNCFALRC